MYGPGPAGGQHSTPIRLVAKQLSESPERVKNLIYHKKQVLYCVSFVVLFFTSFCFPPPPTAPQRNYLTPGWPLVENNFVCSEV